jgi:hypothetical protein
MGSAAQEVHRAVPGDAHEPPGHPSSLRIVALPPIPGTEKRILQDLSSELRVTHDAERQRVHEAPVSNVEGFERRLIPEPHPTEQLGVGRLLDVSYRRWPHAPEIVHRDPLDAQTKATDGFALMCMPTE